jgi:radical SAM superfamily enzyme YgiQ (UPF0313 family)
MRIVVVSPSAPRFDATVHYWLAEFAAIVAYLRRRFPAAETVAVPAGLICAPTRVVTRELLSEPDFLLLWTRVWEAPAARALAEHARQVSPATRILSWGDAPLFIPRYFTRAPFDGAVVSGDPELVLADAIEHLAAKEQPEHGLAWRAPSGDWVSAAPGRWLPSEQWPFPDPSVIAFADYRLARELRGKPTDDLSFDVSRGCPVGCAWCVDPLKGGRADRRRPVRDTVAFMLDNLGPYAQFQCHGPIFTADRAWVNGFVGELRRRGRSVPFKAVTLVNHLTDERLVGDLASVGMRAIGFGIETLTADRSRRSLTPKVAERHLDTVAAHLRRHGVDGKAYTQVGLPGQGREDVLYTHRVLRELGFTVRPTGATPFHGLGRLSAEELDRTDLARYDRKSYFDPACGLSQREFFRLIAFPETFTPDAEVGG